MIVFIIIISNFQLLLSLQLPTVEPHAVLGLTKLLEPFCHTNLRGDAYFFLRELFSAKQ